MHRQKGTLNTPATIMEGIVAEHVRGVSVRMLAEKYGKPYKTIKNMIYREGCKNGRHLPENYPELANRGESQRSPCRNTNMRTSD